MCRIPIEMRHFNQRPILVDNRLARADRQLPSRQPSDAGISCDGLPLIPSHRLSVRQT
jgi:hypothetical protein